MQTLVYCSRQAIEPPDLYNEVLSIIGASIKHNRAVSVTGLLLIHEGYFVQALEGPTPSVESTYLRIVGDPRHRYSKVLLRRQTPTRAFAHWNMCARRIAPTDDAITRALQKRGPFDPFGFSGDAALRLLLAVRDIQERAQSRQLA